MKLLWIPRLGRLVSQAQPLAWLVLIGFVVFTWWSVVELRHREVHLAQERFDLQVGELLSAIRTRMIAHEQILVGGAALFGAGRMVSEQEWRAYVERLRLEHHYPGVQALGFSQVVRADALPEHLARMRERLPDYQWYPEEQRELYSINLYIEPGAAKDFSAPGVDLFSEPVLRQALEAAVSDDASRISGHLLPMDDKEISQPGFFMVLPVYRPDLPTSTAAQRWLALQGFVYSSHRLEDLMQGILGQRDVNLHFMIHTDQSRAPHTRLYPHRLPELHLPQGFDAVHELPLHGQTWILDFYSDPSAFPGYWRRLEQVAIALGLSTGLLLFLLISFVVNERQRVSLLAQKMTQDIQQKVEDLRLSEERLRLALESSAMGTWNWHRKENVIHWDDSIHPLFGLPEGQRLTTYESFLACVYPDDREEVSRIIARALENKTSFDAEFRVVWPDRSLHVMASRARVLLDERQEPMLMTGTCWDITEKKRIEKMKNEFVATVSHELRTPLTSIAGALALLGGGKVAFDSQQGRNLLDIAQNNSQRLHRLINDLLDVEKLSQAQMHFNLQPCALVPLLERALSENTFYAERQGVRFSREFLLVQAEVLIDNERFLQVMTNLLSNAVKFSEPGGEVHLRLEASRPGWVRVSVKDHGIGIAPENQPFIFDKFFQVDGSDKRKKGGTGLGLAIARMMVEQMQGIIGMESVTGEGSCFYVEFPVAGEN